MNYSDADLLTMFRSTFSTETGVKVLGVLMEESGLLNDPVMYANSQDFNAGQRHIVTGILDKLGLTDSYEQIARKLVSIPVDPKPTDRQEVAETEEPTKA